MRGPQLRAASGGLERGRDFLVTGQRGHGLMPDAAVGVLLTGKRPSESRVSVLALAERRSLLKGRADQRMAEADRPARDVDQTGALGRVENISPEMEPGHRPQDGRRISGVVGSGDEQGRLRCVGQPADPAGTPIPGAG